MAVVVEPERSDPWLRHFVAPGMTFCVLREVPDNGAAAPGGDGTGELERLLGDLVRARAAPGTSWVAHLSGPLDEVVAAVEVTGRAADRSLMEAERTGAAPTAARATLVLPPHDPSLKDLIDANRRGHRTLALLQVRREAVPGVVEALDRGDDRSAIAAAEVVVLQQGAEHRSTFAVREPANGRRHAAPPRLAPGAVLAAPARAPRGVRPTRERRPRRALVAVAVAALMGAAAAVALLREGMTPAPRSSAPPLAQATPAPLSPAASAASGTVTGPLTGTLVAAAPPARRGAAVVFDAGRGNAVLFGGTAAGGSVLGDTWVFDGHAWAQAHPARVPPPRTDAAMTYDPGIHEVVMFGGASPAGKTLDDTWIWDGTAWKNLIPTKARPAAGPPAGLAFDDAHQSLVLVVSRAARTAAPVATQTWTWGGTTWHELGVATAPMVGGNTAMTYDPATHRTVLVDAGNGSTWTFDGAAWAQQPGAGPRLDPAARVQLGYNALDGTLVLVQSSGTQTATTQTYDGSRWTQLSTLAAPRAVAGLVSNAVTGQPQAFAGPALASDLAEVWTWQGANWGP